MVYDELRKLAAPKLNQEMPSQTPFDKESLKSAGFAEKRRTTRCQIHAKTAKIMVTLVSYNHFEYWRSSLFWVGCRQLSNEIKRRAPISIEITSTAFTAEATIPKQYTGDGADQSPPLQWSKPPSGTQSIALICDDPDAPGGTWVHWVLYNLPPSTRELGEGVPTTATLDNGAMQGRNDFGNIGYGGPAPPKGKAHRYFFKLYALDVSLDLSTGATKSQLEVAMKGHVLAEGQMMATYKR